jgi:hypothetical protein
MRTALAPPAWCDAGTPVSSCPTAPHKKLTVKSTRPVRRRAAAVEAAGGTVETAEARVEQEG